MLLSDLQTTHWCIAQMAWVLDQGIVGAAGVIVMSPALKACGESTLTMLAGSFIPIHIVLDAYE